MKERTCFKPRLGWMDCASCFVHKSQPQTTPALLRAAVAWLCAQVWRLSSSHLISAFRSRSVSSINQASKEDPVLGLALSTSRSKGRGCGHICCKRTGETFFFSVTVVGMGDGVERRPLLADGRRRGRSIRQRASAWFGTDEAAAEQYMSPLVRRATEKRVRRGAGQGGGGRRTDRYDLESTGENAAHIREKLDSLPAFGAYFVQLSGLVMVCGKKRQKPQCRKSL